VAMAVYLVAVLAYLWTVNHGTTPVVFWHPNLFFWTTGGTLLFICIGSFWKMRELHEGGGVIARILGGRPVPPQTRDPRERQLRNVVEEMAIASGVPVPELYLLDRERGINAFAAGHGPDDAVICVTRNSATS